MNTRQRRRPAPGSRSPRLRARLQPRRRPLEGDLRCAHPRRRVGAVSVAVGILVGWGAGEGRAPSWDAYAGVRPEPTILGLTVTHITNLGLDIPADAR